MPPYPKRRPVLLGDPDYNYARSIAEEIAARQQEVMGISWPPAPTNNWRLRDFGERASAELLRSVEPPPLPEGLIKNMVERTGGTYTPPGPEIRAPRWYDSPSGLLGMAMPILSIAGKPLQLYHGTKSEIKKFDLRKAGKSDPGLVGDAVYLSPSPAQASDYALNPNYGKGNTPNVVPVYADLNNPVYIKDGKLPDGRSLTQIHPNGITKESSMAIKKELVDKGYDGAIFTLGDDVTQVAVFNPKGVKFKYEKSKLPDMVFDSGGDAVGREYHGWIAGFDKTTGNRIGYVDYTYHNGKTYVRMIETEPEFRRRGVATKLMEKLRKESEGPIEILGDFATDEGKAFWKSIDRK